MIETRTEEGITSVVSYKELNESPEVAGKYELLEKVGEGSLHATLISRNF